jgi:hypothetical protein
MHQIIGKDQISIGGRTLRVKKSIKRTIAKMKLANRRRRNGRQRIRQIVQQP